MQQYQVLCRLNKATDAGEETTLELLLDGPDGLKAPDGLPNRTGAAMITTVLVAALSAHLYATDQRGYKSREEHLQFIVQKLAESERMVNKIIVETT